MAKGQTTSATPVDQPALLHAAWNTTKCSQVLTIGIVFKQNIYKRRYEQKLGKFFMLGGLVPLALLFNSLRIAGPAPAWGCSCVGPGPRAYSKAASRFWVLVGARKQCS